MQEDTAINHKLSVNIKMFNLQFGASIMFYGSTTVLGNVRTSNTPNCWETIDFLLNPTDKVRELKQFNFDSMDFDQTKWHYGKVILVFQSD